MRAPIGKPPDVVDQCSEIPIHRLVVPRVAAMIVVAVALNFVIGAGGLIGGFFFSVFLQGATPGAYVHSLPLFTGVPELLVGVVKAFVFGLVAALIAAYRGLTGFLADYLILVLFYETGAGNFSHHFFLYLTPLDIVFAYLQVVVMVLVVIAVHTHFGFTASGGPAEVARPWVARSAPPRPRS